MFKICDAHNDLLYVAKSNQQIKDYFQNLPKEVEKVFCAYFSYNGESFESVEDMKQKFYYLQNFSKAIFSVENCWFLNKDNLNNFIQAKPFCATLSHNKNNILCGGALDNGELTNFGKNIIKIFQANKIVVDTAHMNEKSFWQFIRQNHFPIFNSHTGFNQIFNHKRNLSNNQIEEIVKSNGFIGLAMYPNFFTEKRLCIDDLCKIIFWFWDKYGTNTLGLGTDFNGIEKYPIGIKNYKNLQKLAKTLHENGAKKEDIENLFSSNLLSIYKKLNN